MIGNSKYVPLLPEHGVNLLMWGDDDQSFIQLFQECWKRIPEEDRLRIAKLLKHGNRGTAPKIEISDCWCGCDKINAQVRGTGQYITDIRFSASAFRLFPRGASQFIISHELAHVFQKARGQLPGGVGDVSEDDNEDEADQIANNWGFDQFELDFINLWVDRCGLAEACEKANRLIHEHSDLDTRDLYGS